MYKERKEFRSDEGRMRDVMLYLCCRIEKREKEDGAEETEMEKGVDGNQKENGERNDGIHGGLELLWASFFSRTRIFQDYREE